MNDDPSYVSDESIDYDAGMKQTREQMFAAEEALIRTGFPEEQWRLIREYIGAVVLHNQMIHGKRLEQWSKSLENQSDG